MKLSLDRIEFIANKLSKLNGDTILDLGCRDMILKKFLKGNFIYYGVDSYDLNQSDDTYIQHNLEKGVPNNVKGSDIIVALDVLEHIENIHEIYSQLFSISKKKVVIALPNMAYYKFRLNFLFRGVLSKKYIFSEKKIIDRHRWIPNYKSIEKFIKFNTPNNWKITKYNFIAARKNFSIMYILEKILSKFFPNIFIYELIYIIKREK